MHYSGRHVVSSGPPFCDPASRIFLTLHFTLIKTQFSVGIWEVIRFYFTLSDQKSEIKTYLLLNMIFKCTFINVLM